MTDLLSSGAPLTTTAMGITADSRLEIFVAVGMWILAGVLALLLWRARIRPRLQQYQRCARPATPRVRLVVPVVIYGAKGTAALCWGELLTQPPDLLE
jgi:hypothetical protein